MAETDRRRLITSTPHLSPDEVLQRSFTTSFRGYSETEVRAFLRRISEDLVTTREREAELVQAIDSLEEQLRAPRPLNEPEMLDALGAETTRLLRSAREAADEIRAKAEERATQLVDDARAEAERIGAETEEYARSRTEEADAHVAALVSGGEANAAEMRAELDSFSAGERERAEREAAEIVEAARQQGRDMLDEAKTTRERVLSDLFRRRTLLQAQIDELRSGRDHLLDAYRVVKRTFLEATGALAQVEARAAADRVAAGSDGGPIDASLDSAVDVEPVDADASAAADAPVGQLGSPESGSAGLESSAAPTDAGEATDPSLADVDSLFARIRAGQAEVTAVAPDPVVADATAVGEAAAGAVPAEADAPVVGEPDTSTPADASDAVVTEAVETVEAAEAAEAVEADPPDAVASWRSRRAELLDPLIVDVSKRAKRAAQDDQNALLDAVRRHKGRPTSAQVLVPETDLLTAWASVLQGALDEAYGAGRVMAGGETARAEDAIAFEAAATIVLPVRDRIASAIDTGEDGDTGGLAERIGARFREWKNQSLEDALVDAVALAWARGVYDASPDGAELRWIPEAEGRCADCDDNGLEPTVKGSSFPTGQLHPPAHPGCRCLLAPAEVLRQLAAPV